MFRKVTDEDIIHFIVNHIARGNPASARLLLDKYYRKEDVIKVTLERFKNKEEALAILGSIYGGEEVETEAEKPEKSKKASKKEKAKKNGGGEKMEYVSFDEFAKLDLRVGGKVIEVKDHPNADRLYLVKVDLGGDEVRQLVAGLKKYYRPEELLNRYVVIVANLEPKKLRGVESQGGMLLAADDGGENVALLMPDKEVKLGSRIR